jgi:hypothetical protein
VADQISLTEQHRQAQLKVRSLMLRDFLLLWPIWTGDTASFGSLVGATMPLLRVYRQASASLAGAYYGALRTADRAAGTPAVRLAGNVNVEQVTKSMYVTGQAASHEALAGGSGTEQARTDALTRVSGAVTRHVLAGGRETILDSVAADPQAIGWARVTDGDPCYFCLTLAARGAVYKTETSAGFEAHDHCGCSAVPLWNGSALPAGTDRWRQIYEDAQRDGLDKGLLQHGENTSAARLNAVRRYLAANQ